METYAQLISIGSSKGIRLPKFLLQKYGFSKSLLLEETERGILLRKKNDNKLSYKETYKAMAQEQENWEDFDQTLLVFCQCCFVGWATCFLAHRLREGGQKKHFAHPTLPDKISLTMY
jgi:antitoxin component of MazEF toxin-antitoxin module